MNGNIERNERCTKLATLVSSEKKITRAKVLQSNFKALIQKDAREFSTIEFVFEKRSKIFVKHCKKMLYSFWHIVGNYLPNKILEPYFVGTFIEFYFSEIDKSTQKSKKHLEFT